jgi:hypothetical protein
MTAGAITLDGNETAAPLHPRQPFQIFSDTYNKFGIVNDIESSHVKRLESKDMAKKERCNNLEGDCIAWVAARAGVVG